MTDATLTYGNIFLEDCLDISQYAETESSLTCALTADPADVFKLEGTPNDAGDEYAYYERDITDFAALLYPNWKLRYKTSNSSNALGAKVELVFDDASTEVIFGTIPQFSTSWTVETGTITAAKTVSKIRFYADDYPDSVNSDTTYVHYDFLMFYEGSFTFPHLSNLNGSGGIFADFGNKIGTININGRDTDIKQKAGRRNTVFTLRGDMVDGEGWGTPYGLYFLKMLDDTWCWFTSDLGEMKVIVKDFKPSYDASTFSQAEYDLVLEEFSYSDKGHVVWSQKGWLGV